MNPYNLIIRLGRKIENPSFNPRDYPEEILELIELISLLMEGEKVSDFFTLFPPVKNYEDDGTWDYHSTLKEIENIGTHFTRDSFIELLMTHCYENDYVGNLGLAFMVCTSELYKRKTGKSAMEEFFNQNGMHVYEERNGEVLPKLYAVK